jgi:uncharacterized protein (TIGR02117 family)
LKKILKISAITLGSFAGLILVYLLAAWGLSRITVYSEASTKPEVTIFIKTNGVHTDIVVPTRSAQMDWSKEIKFAYTRSGDTTGKYLGLGWGDKGFYLETPEWSDLKASVAFKAAFALGTTAIHATYYPELAEGQDCRKILISNEQYARLVTYITNSLQKCRLP